MYRRNTDAAQRFAARRQREDEADRLLTVVPQLTDLVLQVEERRAETLLAEACYTRRIVVAIAPAVFVIPCGDTSCKEGGHDVTDAVLRGLRNGSRTFEGHDACRGSIGSTECQRQLRWIAQAEYRK